MFCLANSKLYPVKGIVKKIILITVNVMICYTKILWVKYDKQ